jgi:hypothetical protein
MTESALTEPAVFVLADRALAKVVAQISDEQWEMSMPATFAIRQATEVPSLREVVNYHAYDDAWVHRHAGGKDHGGVGRRHVRR